jgi:DNA gyrase/topoisomerase IV subunit A
MTYDGKIYCIKQRSIKDQLTANFKQNFSADAFALDALGLGAFKNINKQHTGYYYVSLNNPLNEPIPTTANASNLSWFIKAFAFERRIKLENATFELKNLTKNEQKEIKKEEKEIKKEQQEIKKEQQEIKKEEQEIKKEELSSFGKKRFKKQLKNNLLKRLRMDLKKVTSKRLV